MLIVPEQITFGSTKALNIFFQNNNQFLITTAIMSYVNDAPPGFNAAIGREYIRFEIGNKKYQYLAHQTVNTSSETMTLKVHKNDDSGPFVVSAGSAISHEVLFEPHRVTCIANDPDCTGSLPTITWADFKDAVKKAPKIRVTLLADVYGKATLATQCTVVLNANDIRAFETDNQEWAAPECHVETNDATLWDKLLRNSESVILTD